MRHRRRAFVSSACRLARIESLILAYASDFVDNIPHAPFGHIRVARCFLLSLKSVSLVMARSVGKYCDALQLNLPAMFRGCRCVDIFVVWKKLSIFVGIMVIFKREHGENP